MKTTNTDKEKRKESDIMLAKFAVKNFKNFKDRVELDLTKHGKYEFNDFAIKNEIIKDAIIFGPNGSGKSNFGYAMFDIVIHLSQKFRDLGPYLDATYGGDQNSLMEFEYTFDFDGMIIDYLYKKDHRERLVEESLTVNGKQIFKKDQTSFTLDRREFSLNTENDRMLLSSENNISIINYLLASFPIPKEHYLNRLKEFVDSMLWFRSLDERRFMGLASGPEHIDQFVINNNLFEDLSAFLKEVSDQDYVFYHSKPGDKRLFCIIDGRTLAFDSLRSTGTTSLYLLYFWLKRIPKTKLVFIDEFDAFYHFSLSLAVCRKLFAFDNTQVILTSHNTFLMSNDLLRPDCNFILKDNRLSALNELTDKELRRANNMEKLYRGGTFE